MKRVIIESPFAGDVEANIVYARRAVRDSLMRGEAPIASHLLHTQDGILDDGIPSERAAGIAAGLEWVKCADLVAVYIVRGVSSGMMQGILAALEARVSIEFRKING